ncbi:hypothetical protein Lfu02_72920 [Longispora fulva]|nr:hypothetical protein Lfu02_72920 [Longispora fulva]
MQAYTWSGVLLLRFPLVTSMQTPPSWAKAWVFGSYYQRWAAVPLQPQSRTGLP